MGKRQYCFKIKRNWLKLERLKKFGFDLFLDPETNEGFWAKKLNLELECSISKFLKAQLEMIYSKGGEKYKKELLDSGYEFDTNGKLVINEAFTSGLNAELCVSINASDSDKGCLFINIEGMEWHEEEILRECAPDIINTLLENHVIYRKRI